MIIRTTRPLPESDDFTFTAIDFELANNSPCSICQIGFCVVERGSVVKSAEYFVRPPKGLCFFLPKPVEIHGITYDDVARAPSFAAVWQKMLPYVKGRPLAAHSFRDDAKALAATLAFFGVEYDCRAAGYLCTLELALHAGISGENNKYSLESLCGRYSLPLCAHHAGSDAEGCARLALKIAEELGVSSFRRLVEISCPPGVPEPELPDLLSCGDVEKIEKYVSRLKSRENIRLSDCPRARQLGRAKRVLHRAPETRLEKATAMSANALNNWLTQAERATGTRRAARANDADTAVPAAPTPDAAG